MPDELLMRQVPQDLTAEQSLLGAMLVDPNLQSFRNRPDTPDAARSATEKWFGEKSRAFRDFTDTANAVSYFMPCVKRWVNDSV